MTANFTPKISYRMAGMFIHPSYQKPTSPWQYLEDWERSDRRPEDGTKNCEAKMKERWPGNYRIVTQEHELYDGTGITKWALWFDNPAEETMFRLKWA